MSKEGPLKDNVEVVESVYIDEMIRMRYGEICSILRCIVVDTGEICDTSFVGKSIYTPSW